MASCGDCALSKKCNNSYLKGRGSRPAKTEIMVIQEFPTYFDDRVGKALSGDTQKKLTYFFEMAGIDHREVYFTSALKCSPKKSADVKNVHLDECRKYLFHEILTHKPKIIIAMGRWAYQAVTDHTSIREFRGHFDSFSLDYDNEVGGREVTNTFECKVMPTWSLGTSLKKWEYNGDIIRDFKKSQKYVKTGNVPMLPDPKTNLILTRRGLKDFIEKYREVEKATTDFETTGFNFWTDKVINAGYAADGNNADVIYLTPYKKEHMAKHIKKTDKWEALWDKENIEKAKEINAFLKGNRKHCLKALQIVNSFDHLNLILHNGKFDIKFARKYGIDYKNFWFDTLMADPLIDENLGHSLNIAMERRGINYGAYDTLLWPYTNKDEKKKKSYQHVPPILLTHYLGIDVCGDMRLFNKQVKELKSEGLYDHMMETKMPALHERIDAEWIGVKADRELILKSSRIVQKKQKKLMKKLIEVTGNEEFNPNSPDQINNYMQDNGYPFKKLKVKETNKGYSTAKDELAKFLKYKKYKEFPQLILNCKKLTKIRGTYIDGKDGDGGMLQYLDKNDRIHANYNLWTPRTSRYSCFAKGTPIEVARDVSKNVKGVPIESVKVGDLAYCYDNENRLVLRKVTRVFKNGGKRIKRLHWASSGGRIGFIDLTPDHRIKTDRGFVRADELVMGEKLFFLSRKKGIKYEYLVGNNIQKYDHHFCYEQANGSADCEINDIHHLDHNHKNNHPDNLVEWDKEYHKSYHAKIWSSTEEHKRRSSEQLKNRWKNDRPEMLKIMSGSNNKLYKGWSKYKILKIIMRSGCRLKFTGYDYYTVRKYLELNGIDYKKLKDRFTHQGEFIPSYKILKCLDEDFSLSKIKDYLKVGQNKWYRLRDEYGMDTNHTFVTLEDRGESAEVYDLEVEEFHNYIAGEICAHNCNSPSLQVWPRPIKGLPNTRNFIIPRNKDWMLFEADYSQLEQCVVAALAKDKVLTQRIQDGMDLHCINAADLGHKLKNIPDWVTYEHMLVTNEKENLITDPQLVKELMKDVERHGADINFKEKRTHAKNIGFGLNYGKIAMTFAEEFGISIDEAEEMVDAYFEVYYGMKEWRDNIIEEALTVGHISLLSGRKRRFTEAMRWLNHELCEGVWSARMLREEIGRQAMNYPVQGGAHEVFEPAVTRLNNRFRAEGLKAVIMLSIHDGIVGECPREEKEAVRKCILEEMPHTFHPNTDMAITLKVDVDFYKWEWYGEKIK